MMVYDPGALHPGTLKQKKKGKLGGGPLPKGATAKRGKIKAQQVNDPLTRLYASFIEHGREMTGVPAELIAEAHAHIINRRRELKDHAKANSHTTRIAIQRRWLHRWLKLIILEEAVRGIEWIEPEVTP